MGTEEENSQLNTNVDFSEKKEGKKPRTGAGAIAIDLLAGVAVGAGAILPGFSGGVLCVVLGMYPLVMELFSHPIRALKKNFLVYILIGIGWAVGFFAVSNLIKFMYARYEVFTVWTFIGMIFGNIPSPYKEAGKKGRSRSSFVSMAVAFVVMFALLFGVSMIHPEYRMVSFRRIHVGIKHYNSGSDELFHNDEPWHLRIFQCGTCGI